MAHLQQLNPETTFDVFASVALSSHHHGSEQSQRVARELVERVYGVRLVAAEVSEPAAEWAKPVHLLDSQTNRWRVMHWRMQRGWELVEPHLWDYSLVVWMRPDVLVRIAVPFEAVAVGGNVHTLVGLHADPLHIDFDYSMWGTPEAMRIVLTQAEWVDQSRCECGPRRNRTPDTRPFGFANLHQRGITKPQPGVVPHRACFDRPGGNNGHTWCTLFQRLWRNNRTLWLVGYGAAGIIARDDFPARLNESARQHADEALHSAIFRRHSRCPQQGPPSPACPLQAPFAGAYAPLPGSGIGRRRS